MNAFTMSKKAAIMDWNQPKLRPNMGIYKLATVPEDEGSAVVLMTEGDAGRYNRANRATYHFLENSIAFVFSQYAAFYIFPFPAFVLLCAFSFGRIAYQIGYTSFGMGGHLIGFLFDRIATATLTGLFIIAYSKSF